MFEQFMPGNNQRAELEAEKRQATLSRDLTAMQISANDAAYMQEQNARSDLIRWQQELDIGLEFLKHRLRSHIRDADGNWTSSGVPPLMTEEGISMVEAQLSPFLGEEAKNLINSYLTEENVLLMLKGTSDVIVDSLADNYDTYLVNPTPSNMSHCMRLIKNAMIPTPYRALNGWTHKSDSAGIKRIETYQDSPNNERRKILGII